MRRPWGLLLLLAIATVADCREKSHKLGGGDEDIAGPIVKSHGAKRVEVVPTSSANLTLLVNGTIGEEKKKTIAQIIDEALEQEFPEEKKEKIGKNYNETALQEDATVETVIKVSGNKRPEVEVVPEETPAPVSLLPDAEPNTFNSIIHHSWGHLHDRKAIPEVMAPAPKPVVPAAAAAAAKAKQKERARMDANVEKEVDRIIDSQDNEYVLSRPKDGAMGLTLDPQLIRDLTVLITSSTLGGMLLEALRQPIINGYFIAGSVVGPGGLKLIKELVQVESLAQVGVQLLLFTLGLEFSLSKLRAVRSVALLGGMVEIFLFIIAAGVIAHFIGASVHEGIFVGALVSMSSTSIVIKCLHDSKSTGSPHGQITIGTLILQDCMVGLLFAFMPVLANNRSGGEVDHFDVLRLLFRVTLSLGSGILVAVLVARMVLPPAVRLLAKHASTELYQLTLISFCLCSSWLSGYMGLSTELGAFVAGVMLSATEQQENALHQLEHLKQFFLSLFICSTGLIMSPTFLAQHLRVLAGGLVVTVLAKTVLISVVVYAFKYPVRTALAVGLSMAQIGEFAFVLLSVASTLGLLPYQVYMLLMGITALSLLVTPFLMQAARHILRDGTDGIAPLPTAWSSKGRVGMSKRAASGESIDPSSDSSSPGSPSPRLEQRHHSLKQSMPAHGSAYPSEVQLQQRYPFL
ncbi:g1406 [Coccomyxa elongata]